MSPFDLGKGKYKHRVSDDQTARVAKRVQSYNLDEATIAGIAKLARERGCNKSSLVRILVHKELEMSNEADVA
jgi:DNA invertase Pin-like site-specific DNA recombinase